MSKTEQQIDVRKLSPREKHPTIIIETFQSLAQGDSFIILPENFASTPTYSMYSGQAKTAQDLAEKPSTSSKANIGATLYRTSCASCHQGNGEGVTGAFPPLSGDPVVTADDPTRHIEIILFGMQGKAIDGVEYSAAMPPFSEQLSDEEVAAIINHERTSWGNDAPTVTADDVQKVRSKGKPDSN